MNLCNRVERTDQTRIPDAENKINGAVVEARLEVPADAVGEAGCQVVQILVCAS